MLNIAVLVSGRGSNLQAIIEAIEEGWLKVKIAGVISDQEDALALKRAMKHNLPVIFINPKNFPAKAEYEEKIIDYLKKREVSLVVLAGYRQLVSSTLLSAYPDKIINIHPSLLPSFPGLDSQKQALEYGVKITGATVHFVDKGCDTGPIILQSPVKVLEDDTSESLSERILREEHQILPQAISLFAQGKLNLQRRRVTISD
ncbi:phosphoribosylglycinamide formyltransferase [bacterium]|nr:phosphoribosylglycinamide formyltransferase [bacterium]MBU1782343.1 phosphoribosylglycinamide formyltransferase [bacterium]